MKLPLKFTFVFPRLKSAVLLICTLSSLLIGNGCSLKDTIQGSIGNSSESDTSPTVPFGTQGVVHTNMGGAGTDDYGTSMLVQGDGKVLVGGNSNGGGSNDFILIRYNTDGSLDSSFGSSGKVTTDLGTTSADFANTMILQSDGKILLAGTSNTSGSFEFALVRYTSSGALDTSFGTAGKVFTSFGGSFGDARAVKLQSDSKILVAGYIFTGADNDFAVARYNTDGSLDASFGTAGKVTTNIGSTADYAYGMAVQSDGKIIVVGEKNLGGLDTAIALARYSTSGVLDASFGTGGIVTTNIDNDNDRATGVALQSDGKILVTGVARTATNSDFVLARYSTSGALDTSFGSAGTVTTDIAGGSGSDDAANALMLQSDGKIIVGGTQGVRTYNGAGLMVFQYFKI